MTERAFIGPNGARFTRSTPLPQWLVDRVKSGEITEVLPPLPPRVGAGSGRGAWATYADSVGVPTTDAMTRDQIIAVIEEAS